jgi:hypothetical protein
METGCLSLKADYDLDMLVLIVEEALKTLMVDE